MTPPLRVGTHGEVRLPHHLTASRWRIELVDARFPAETPAAARRRRAVGIGELSGAGVPRAATTNRGPLHASCGDAALTVAGARIPLLPAGSVAELDAGRSLHARGCRAATVPRGRVLLSSAAGPLRVDLLRLDSPAPRPVADTGTGGGRVLDPGQLGRGRIDGARLALGGPSWLVLGESYSRAWRARCDGRDLGKPVPIDGYANGWPVERCHRASFSFAANGPVRASYWLSLLAAAALLAWLALRPAPLPPSTRSPSMSEPVASAPPAARPAALRSRRSPGEATSGRPLLAAALIGALAAAVLGFLFALRVGVVAGPLVALVLWRGIGARTLAATAAILLGVVVPAIYLLHTPPDLGGFNSNYGIDLIAAHWVGVIAAICAGLAVWRAGRRIRLSRAS